MKNPVIKTGFVVALFLPLLASAGQSPAQARIAALCDSLMAQLPAVPVAPRLAVLPFIYNGDSSLNGPGRTVAECVVARLRNNPKVKLVDRMDFRKAVMELKASASTVIDPATALALGKLESAQYLLTGSVGTTFDEARITAHITAVETGRTVAAAGEMANVVSLQQYARELIVEKAQVQSSVFRSMVLPGWGQIYTEHYWRGGACMAAFFATVGVTGYQGQRAAVGKRNWKAYADMIAIPDSMEARARADSSRLHIPWKAAVDGVLKKTDTLYSTYSKQFDRTLVWAAIAGGVYLVNLIDGSLAGVSARKKFAPYFSANVIGRSGAAGVCVKF